MTSEIITAITAAILGGGTIMGLVKAGYIKGSISIGKNGNGNELKAIKMELETLQSNHLEHIEAKLEKLVEMMQETLIIVRQFQK